MRTAHPIFWRRRPNNATDSYKIDRNGVPQEVFRIAAKQAMGIGVRRDSIGRSWRAGFAVLAAAESSSLSVANIGTDVRVTLTGSLSSHTGDAELTGYI